MTEAKIILAQYVQKIPKSIIGSEKIGFVVDLVQEMPAEHRIILHKLLNYILALMLEREASDVEIGGYGTDEYIWIRVHGE